MTDLHVKIVGDNAGDYGHLYIGIEQPDGSYAYFGFYPTDGQYLESWDGLYDDGVLKLDNARYQNATSDPNISYFEVTLSISAAQSAALSDYVIQSVNNIDYFGVALNCVDWVHHGLILSGVRENGLETLLQEGTIDQTDLDQIGLAGNYIDEKYYDGVLGSIFGPEGSNTGHPSFDTIQVQPGSNLWDVAKALGWTDAQGDVDIDAFIAAQSSATQGWINDNRVIGANGDDIVVFETGDSVSFAPGPNYQAPSISAPINTTLGYWEEAGNARYQMHDPLVLDMDGDGLELVSVSDSTALFDLDADGFANQVGWVAADDGLLALDRNSNGTIDNISELFGNDSLTGLEELAQLDTNSDGYITATDSQFGDLRIWQDTNQNGVSEASELPLPPAAIIPVLIETSQPRVVSY